MRQKRDRIFKHAMRAAVMAAGILLVCLIPVRTLRAGSAQQVGNLVFFLRSQSDGDNGVDVYNKVFDHGTYQTYNWDDIKKMYNTGNSYQYDNSFRNYISVITEGKVEVVNVFPQELSADEAHPKGSVAVYTLKKDYYDTDSELIAEVIEALNQGQIPMTREKVDYLSSGIVDNVTFILQGDTIPGGKQEAHKSDYSGEETFSGLRICSYNMIPSDSLVSEAQSVHISSEQGVIAHEFLHTLGLPDLYRIGREGVPVGPWDVMASVSPQLQYPLSYLRAEQGWIPMEEITQSGTYTLTAVSGQGGSKVFLLKTPLSDSEFICLEYRKKGEAGGYFERSLPESGLIAYRVDTKTTDPSNSRGENYIYVYRPDVTDPENATDTYSVENPYGGTQSVNNVYKAALTPGEVYGSTDLSKDWRENTLYYSDGSNSGIAVSDLSLSQDGVSLTFHIEFADYGNSQAWSSLGESLGSEVYDEPSLLVDQESGELYVAFTDGWQSNAKITVKKWNQTQWQQLGETVYGEAFPELAICDGELYLSTRSWDGSRLSCRRLEGSRWGNVAEYSAENVQSSQTVVSGSDIYLAFQSAGAAGYRLTIMDLKKNVKVAESREVSNMGNPAVCKLGTRFYVVYSDVFSDGEAVVEAYDTSEQKWMPPHGLGVTGTNSHAALECDGKLYVFAGYSGKSPVAAIYDGVQWADFTVPQMTDYRNVSLNLMGGEVYLTYCGAVNDKGCLLRKDGETFTLLSDKLGTGLLDFKVQAYGNTLYTVQKPQNSTKLYVKKMEIELPQYELKLTPPSGYDSVELYLDGVPYAAEKVGDGSYGTHINNSNMRAAEMRGYGADGKLISACSWKLVFQNGGYHVGEMTVTPGEKPAEPTEKPPVESLELALKVQDGYSEPVVWLDGVAYPAEIRNGYYNLTAADKNAKTAVAYRYNASGVPNGMYVWSLSYDGKSYRAEEQPGLADLLTAHGFSIRITGKAGIRFRTGISVDTRATLTSTGINGYTLKEYGTLTMNYANLNEYPMILGGQKTTSGMAFGVDANGVRKDAIYEIASDRYRYTSVLVGLPVSRYKTEFAFRGYIILEKNGQETILYGPIRSRSIYAIAKQYLAMNTYAPGTDTYNFLKRLISDADAYESSAGGN